MKPQNCIHAHKSLAERYTEFHLFPWVFFKKSFFCLGVFTSFFLKQNKENQQMQGGQQCLQGRKLLIYFFFFFSSKLPQHLPQITTSTFVLS